MRSNRNCCQPTWTRPSAMLPSRMCCQRACGPCSITQVPLSPLLRCPPWLTLSSIMCYRLANAPIVREVAARSPFSPMRLSMASPPPMVRLRCPSSSSCLQKRKKNPPTTADLIPTPLVAVLKRDRPTSGPTCLQATGPEPAQPWPAQTRGFSSHPPGVASALGTGQYEPLRNGQRARKEFGCLGERASSYGPSSANTARCFSWITLCTPSTWVVTDTGIRLNATFVVTTAKTAMSFHLTSSAVNTPSSEWTGGGPETGSNSSTPTLGPETAWFECTVEV